MAILWTLLIGFIVGLVARAIHPGDDKMGFFFTAGLGVAGAVLATIAGRVLGLYAPGEVAGFLAAVVGAVLVLGIVTLVRKR